MNKSSLFSLKKNLSPWMSVVMVVVACALCIFNGWFGVKYYICDDQELKQKYTNLQQKLTYIEEQNNALLKNISGGKTYEAYISKLMSNITHLKSNYRQLQAVKDELGKENTKLIKHSEDIVVQQNHSRMYVL